MLKIRSLPPPREQAEAVVGQAQQALAVGEVDIPAGWAGHGGLELGDGVVQFAGHEGHIMVHIKFSPSRLGELGQSFLAGDAGQANVGREVAAAIINSVAAWLVDQLAKAGIGGFAVLTAVALPADGVAELLAGDVFAVAKLVERVEGTNAVLEAAAQLLAEAEFERGIERLRQP